MKCARCKKEITHKYGIDLCTKCLSRKKVQDPLVYRARGVYNRTGKESYLTNAWRRTRAEAESDIRVFGRDYTKLRIVTIDRYKYANAHPHQKNPYPRIN